jgi:tyrosine-protein phosphatase SIW14
LVVKQRVTSGGTRQLSALFQIVILSFGIGAYGLPSVSAAQQEAPAAAPLPADVEIARKVNVDGLRNFAEVTPTLYRGGQPTPEGWRTLARMGVAIVVDLRVTGRADERAEVTRLGMRYVEIPWQCFHPNDSDFSRFLAVLRDNPGKKVFVHCDIGDDRTGMEIAAYRMAVEKWTSEQARKEMEAFGFTFFHRRVCTGLGAYETQFPQRFANDPEFESLRAPIVPSDSAPSR